MGGWLLAVVFSVLPGLGEGLVTGGKDGHFSAEKFVLGGDVADGGVQTHGVVVLDMRWTPLFGQKSQNLSYGSWGAVTI